MERVRDGRSFATRTVQARQKDKCIFTTTISFVKSRGSAGSGGVNKGNNKQVTHAMKLPEGAQDPPSDEDDSDGSPIMTRKQTIWRPKGRDTPMTERFCRQWTKAKGNISDAGGRKAHLNALAYISDSYFIGTVSRIHELWRFPFRPSAVPNLPDHQRRVVENISRQDGLSMEEWESRPEIGMQVSLDHSIYFHEPERVHADDWMFVEMESPWAGDGRGVVLQRVWGRDGTLLATCTQEVSRCFFPPVMACGKCAC